MKAKKIIVEVICFVLLMNWFYEGIYKVAYWGNFAFWIHHAPLLKPVWQVLAYGVPVFEIVLAIALMVPKWRVRALYVSIAAMMGFVLWVMSAHLFTPRIFWPYHALWEKPTWMKKMLISMGLCWVAFSAVILTRGAKINYRVGVSNDASCIKVA